MRAKQFIIEYDRTKTAQAFTAKLVNTAMADNTVPGAVRNNIQDNLTPLEAAELILTNLEVGDPTKNKKYSQAIAKMYANGLIKWEDIGSTLRDMLTKFTTLGLKKMLKPEHSDFNRFKDVKSFYDVVRSYPDPEEEEVTKKGSAKEIYKDANVRIIKPEDINAACYYGQGTAWCTAAKNNNMFDRYNSDGPMYILLPTNAKKEGEKYQIHPDSGQYMDSGDSPVTAAELIERFGEGFEQWLLKTDPFLGGKIQYFPDEDALRNAIEKIKELAQEQIWEIITDWEMNDDSYYPWLQDNNYIDENGDFTDDAPSYTEYNDEAGAFYSNAYGALDITVDELRELAIDIEIDTGRDQMVGSSSGGDIENVISVSVENALGDNNGGLATWIYQRIQTKLDRETGKIDVELLKEQPRQ